MQTGTILAAVGGVCLFVSLVILATQSQTLKRIRCHSSYSILEQEFEMDEYMT